MVHVNWMLLVAISGIGGIVVGGIITLLVRRWELIHGRIDKVNEPRNYLRDFVKGLIGVCIILIFSEGMIWVAPYLIHGLDSLLQLVGMRLIELFVGGIVVALGALLWIFKMTRLHWYGRIEVMFAAAVAIVTARQFTSYGNWLSVLGTLGGCVYVVTRGLTNMFEGARETFLKNYDDAGHQRLLTNRQTKSPAKLS